MPRTIKMCVLLLAVASAFAVPAESGNRAKGRYWMTRTLVELGELNEREGRPGEARRAWGLILSTGLPGAGLAREQLARLAAPAAKP